MAELSSIDSLICVLQKCRKTKNLVDAKRVHAHICSNGLESHRAVGNYLVPMFVDCGSVADAQQVFNALVYRNVHSWTSLILGYIECGESHRAINLYQKMQEDSVDPSSFTLVTLLKACAKLKDVERGREVHAAIKQKGFEREACIGSSLIDMYTKCGSLVEAQETFDKLPVRNVVTWTALISGYTEHGHGQEALECFEQMQMEDIAPNPVTFICTLKACGSIGAINKGREMHSDIVEKEFERDAFVGSSLVDMYAKCGSLAEAHVVFDKLPVRNVVSCTALIAGYAEYGLGEEALACFEQMQLEGISPNSVTFVCILKACGSIGAIDKGQEIHDTIMQKGFERDVFVGSTLVDMYVKCGSLAAAREAFDKLPVRNVVSWNTLIAGYAEHEFGREAVKCFEQMQVEGIPPDAVTFVFVLKACGSMGDIDKGREIHREIMLKGFGKEDFVCNTLVDMYARCGSLREAHKNFDSLSVRTVVSWNTLIAGYAEYGPCQEALRCYEQMQQDSISPTAVTFVCILKACGSIGAIDRGQEIHVEITQMGFETDAFVGNTLVDMYARCGSLTKSREIFDSLPVRDVVSWNALMAGYIEHGPAQETLKCLEQMQVDGIVPDAVTYVCLLKACGSLGAIDNGREIHIDIAQKGFERDVNVGNALVDMYAKCSVLAEARKVFDKLLVQNVVAWTALIAGYAEHGPSQEALKCFNQMQQNGISPDVVTFVCVLKACGSTGAIEKGQELHADITERGFESDLSVGSGLVDMYAKCGSLLQAREVFEKLPVRDVMAWNAMIKGYGLNHEGNMAVRCFEDMQEQGVKPDDITFTCLLTACSRARLVLKGQEFFNVMREAYGIAPTTDHYACMVDLFARSGHLFEAEKFVESMPCPPVWTAVLSACKIYGEADLGLKCFEQLVQANPECASPYVLMAKIYASDDRWDDTYRIEELRKRAGAKKKPASALIEVNKEVHEFVVGNDQSEEILAMQENLSFRMKEDGHVPSVNLLY